MKRISIYVVIGLSLVLLVLSPANAAVKASYLPSPEPLNTCRVPDARAAKAEVSEAIAYPVTSGSNAPRIPNIGQVNVAVIPIEFPDVKGVGSPSTIIAPEVTQIKKWVAYFSNGKSNYNIQTSTKWYRAAKASNNYIWLHEGHGPNPLKGAVAGPERSASDIASELMRYAEKDFNYKNLNVVLFVYPKKIVNIYDAITEFGPVNTNVGKLNIQIDATGAWLYESNFPMWSWFLHENLHPTGLAGHAPNDGAPFGLLTNQAGASLTLNSWDQSILDWQRINQVYCVSKENLTPTSLPLSSIDTDNPEGTKAIFIKLSSHEVLVVESHKYAYWSHGWLGYPGFPTNFEGLVVYKVDTSVDKNRVQSGTGFANFQVMTGVKNGTYTGPYSPPFDLNSLIKPGQTMKTSGVNISFIKSGSIDTVEIAKAS